MNPEAFQELKDFYATAELPKTLQYNDATFMSDVAKVVRSDIYTLEKYGLINTFAGSWDRLINIKIMIEERKGGY